MSTVFVGTHLPMTGCQFCWKNNQLNSFRTMLDFTCFLALCSWKFKTKGMKKKCSVLHLSRFKQFQEFHGHDRASWTSGPLFSVLA